MTNYLELAWNGSAEVLARALERLEVELRTAARSESGAGERPERPGQERLPDPGGLAPLDVYPGRGSPGVAREKGWTALSVQPAPPWEEAPQSSRGTERTPDSPSAAELRLPLLEKVQRSEDIWETVAQGGFFRPLETAVTGGQRDLWSGGRAGSHSSALEESADLWSGGRGGSRSSALEEPADPWRGLRGDSEAAEGGEPWLSQAGRRSGEAERFALAEQVDRAFQRDSRRYDGGFFLY